MARVVVLSGPAILDTSWLLELYRVRGYCPNYSFADISIIDLAAELRRPGRTVKILAFDEQLLSYSD